METIDCINCSSELDEKSLTLDNIEFLTQEETGTVGGHYHVHVSLNCQQGCTLNSMLKFFPASCPCVGMSDVDDHRKYEIIESHSGYVNQPTGFHREGYGWEVNMECPRCGNQERNTYTLPSLIPKKLESQ